MTTTMWLGIILLVVTIVGLIVYVAYLHTVLDSQTLVIQDLAFANQDLTHHNRLHRKKIGELTDRLQVETFSRWGDEASTS